ncbi:hypothetical protein FRC08_003547, partial [Ceratobasidium sp. 394]
MCQTIVKHPLGGPISQAATLKLESAECRYMQVGRGESEPLQIPKPSPWVSTDITQAFFVVSPNVYVFDKHRIVCCIDDTNRYHQVNSLNPNPPDPETIFYLEGVSYFFDAHSQLWYKLAGQWYPEPTYLDLPSARAKSARCAERNRLAAPIPSTSTSVASTISDATNSQRRESPSSEEEYLYPPLDTNPGRARIDAWFEEFKSRRTALKKT